MKDYKFYCQLDYEHVPYISPTSPNGNLSNNGCGPISMTMILENLLGIDFSPEESGKFAKAAGAREGFGTNFYILADKMVEHFPLNCIVTEDAEEMIEFMRAGKGMVVANTYGDRDDYIGVFSNSGHYVVVAEATGDEIGVLDPMYKEGSGRFDIPGRKGKVRMEGNVAFADYRVLKMDCRERPFFLFSKREEK